MFPMQADGNLSITTECFLKQSPLSSTGVWQWYQLAKKEDRKKEKCSTQLLSELNALSTSSLSAPQGGAMVSGGFTYGLDTP